MYSILSSASAAKDMTDLMIWDVLRMAPLLGALSVLLERKKCPPVQLCTLEADDHVALGMERMAMG